MKTFSGLKDKLPYGAISEIQRLSGKSYPTVIKTLDGKNRNQSVIKALGTYLKEYKEVNSLVSEILG